MTAAYRISPLGKADLQQIWQYVARDRPTAANDLLDTLQGRFALLASQPLLGESRPELGPLVRSTCVGNYAIYYRPAHDDVEVEIVRILHGARDISSSML